MIPDLRRQFNAAFTPEKYQRFLQGMEQRCRTAIQFRICETPCFFPASLMNRMAATGEVLVRQLLDNENYRRASDAAVPAEFHTPGEERDPLFVSVYFGLVRDAGSEPQPRLVELQAFPTLYAYQAALAQEYKEAYGLPDALKIFFGDLDLEKYQRLLRRAILGKHDPENVVLLEIDPYDQKTLPDFLLTEEICKIQPVNIREVVKQGNRLLYKKNGKSIPIHRIYNRVIFDELVRKKIQPPFDFREPLEVEWAGHPNWYFRISKYSIPYLRHESVPKTWFLDKLDHIPEDLENYALKPLYSFAGLGVIIAPTKKDIDAVPADRRSQYILQERLH